jgi:hypothetical protein
VNRRDRQRTRIASAAVACCTGVGVLVSVAVGMAAPTPSPEASLPFGRVIYRAAKVAALESTGVTMIACRHRDPVPRRFALQLVDDTGRMRQTFGAWQSPPTSAGKKVTFVTDRMHFATRADVLNVRVGHLGIGTARVVSDARIVRCIGKMRMDGGVHMPSSRDEIGLVRDGTPLPVMSRIWDAPRRR